MQINLRGLLPKETLILVDGKRVAFGSLGFAGSSQSVDINLIPFPMIDHIDILKDGASAVYGSDAVTGVVNFFLIHKFRGLEIGGSYGNTNLGASNDMGEWEAWIKAGTGDDKTDIVVIADFWERTGGVFSGDRDISSNAFQIPWGGFDARSGNFPGRVEDFRLIPKLFFSANSPPPHSAPNAATSPFYKDPFVVNPNAYPGAPGIVGPHAFQFRPQTGPDYKGGGDYFFYNFAAITPALPPADRQASMVPLRAICVTNTLRCLPILNLSAHISIHPWQLCRLCPIRSRFRGRMWDLVQLASACQSQMRGIRSRSQMRLFQITFPTDRSPCVHRGSVSRD